MATKFAANQALVRFAKAARAQAVADLADLAGIRRLATLVAFASVMPQVAADEAIEVFDLVMGDVIRSSAAKMTKKRLRTLKDLDAAAILLRTAWLTASAAAADPDGDIRAALDAIDVAPFHAAAEAVKELAQDPDDGSEQMPAAHCDTIARFLPGVLDTFTTEADAAHAHPSNVIPWRVARRHAVVDRSLGSSTYTAGHGMPHQ